MTGRNVRRGLGLSALALFGFSLAGCQLGDYFGPTTSDCLGDAENFIAWVDDQDGVRATRLDRAEWDPGSACVLSALVTTTADLTGGELSDLNGRIYKHMLGDFNFYDSSFDLTLWTGSRAFTVGDELTDVTNAPTKWTTMVVRGGPSHEVKWSTRGDTLNISVEVDVCGSKFGQIVVKDPNHVVVESNPSPVCSSLPGATTVGADVSAVVDRSAPLTIEFAPGSAATGTWNVEPMGALPLNRYAPE